MAKVAALAVGRGKCEQIRKNGNKCGRNEKSGCHRTILNILTCVRQLAPIASQGSALPSEFGGSERLRKKEKIVFLFINTLLTITYAGFFAKSQIMFFLLSSFRFYPSLKNDGRGVFVLP